MGYDCPHEGPEARARPAARHHRHTQVTVNLDRSEFERAAATSPRSSAKWVEVFCDIVTGLLQPEPQDDKPPAAPNPRDYVLFNRGNRHLYIDPKRKRWPSPRSWSA